MTETSPSWMQLWQQGQQAMLEAQSKAAEQFSEIMQQSAQQSAQQSGETVAPYAHFLSDSAQAMMAESQRLWFSMMGAPQFSPPFAAHPFAAHPFTGPAFTGSAFGHHPYGFGGFAPGWGNGAAHMFGAPSQHNALHTPMAAWQGFWDKGQHSPQQQYQQWLETLSNGPQFADMPNMLAMGSKALKELLEYNQASLSFRTLLAEGWAKAYAEFVESYSQQDWEQIDPQKVMEEWIDFANKSLLSVQGSSAFLDAQRALLNASLKLKQQQHSHTEAWAKEMGMPTRSEVDELIDLVHSLRQEIAALRH